MKRNETENSFVGEREFLLFFGKTELTAAEDISAACVVASDGGGPARVRLH
jgi:hypothetical protein